MHTTAMVGHRSIVGKSFAYGAKGPGFKTQWRQEFIITNCIVCSVHYPAVLAWFVKASYGEPMFYRSSFNIYLVKLRGP